MKVEEIKALPDDIIVRVSEKDRENLFKKEIVRSDGTTAKLFIEEQEEEGFDRSFAQSVKIGEVLSVGINVKGINVGDIAMMDYLVDQEANNLIRQTLTEKVIRVNTLSKYHRTTKVLFANQRSPRPNVYYRKGDIIRSTLLIATISNDGIIRPMYPYIILEHQEKKDDLVMNEKGFNFIDVEGYSDRVVVQAFEGAEYKPGDIVMCKLEDTFEQTVGKMIFDVIADKDIAAILQK